MSPNESSAVLLVTGAAGKTGRAILRAVAGGDFAVRALIRNRRQRRMVEAMGVAQVVEGDLEDDSAVEHAVRGVDAIYHICPNVHAAETEIGHRILAAAGRTGVERFVFHSVLHPQTEAMPHHWAKLRVEEALIESGLPFTILQPAPYMQNVLGQWERIAAEGVFRVPYALKARLAMVDLADVAAVAARVLSEPGHLGAIYELCGPDLLDQREVAASLGRQLGRAVRAETEAWDVWAANAGFRPGSYALEALAKMFRHYEHHGMAGNPRVLECLLDRPPTGFAEFLARHGAQRRHQHLGTEHEPRS